MTEASHLCGKHCLGRSRRVNTRSLDGNDEVAANFEEVGRIERDNTRLIGLGYIRKYNIHHADKLQKLHQNQHTHTHTRGACILFLMRSCVAYMFSVAVQRKARDTNNNEPYLFAMMYTCKQHSLLCKCVGSCVHCCMCVCAPTTAHNVGVLSLFLGGCMKKHNIEVDEHAPCDT